MEKNLVLYQSLLFKNSLKKQNVMFIVSSMKSKEEIWVKTQKKLTDMLLTAIKIPNVVAKRLIRRTKFKLYDRVISGPMLLLNTCYGSKIKKVSNINGEIISILAIKIKNNIYPARWLNSINSLKYTKTSKKLPMVTRRVLKLCVKYTCLKRRSKKKTSG